MSSNMLLLNARISAVKSCVMQSALMTDPLGALPGVVDMRTLEKWSDTASPEYGIIIDDPLSKKHSPFPFRPDLNAKLALWSGDMTCLNCEAIINLTNEALNDRNPVSERILSKAGPDLKRELRNEVKTCRTGEAKLTKGYRLPARYILHTVGPRFNLRYRTAAESALYNSYRSVLQLIKDKNIKSLGLCCIHSAKRNYPSHEGGHIAVRTVRRFLEKYGHSMDMIVLIANGEDKVIYESLLPLYFPRSDSEADFAAYHLPEDIGNEDGEPVIKERQIRIIPKPTHTMPNSELRSGEELEESVNINEAFESSVAIGNHAFAKMEADVDRKRLSALKKARQRSPVDEEEHLKKVEHMHRYKRWVKRSKREDLGDVEALRCFYQSGFDKAGRAVVIFLGRHFPAEKIDYDKALLYFIQTMDPIVNKPYVVVYLNTLTEREHQPDSDFLKDIYEIVDERYRNNLHAIYMVHTTFWSKMMTWFFTTFSAQHLKNKIQHIPGLEYLYAHILPDQLEMPAFVTEYDIKTNGSRYYNPERAEEPGEL